MEGEEKKKLCLADFEPSRDLRLEDSIRIIPLSHLADELDILIPVPSERVLRDVCVVQVDVLVVLANALGVFIQLSHGFSAEPLEERVIGRVVPGVVVQHL